MLQTIKDFEGIIGAILGVIFTLITTHLLKGIGTIKIYFKDYSIEKHEKDQMGYTRRVKTTSLDSEELIIIIELELYNSADVPKIMRNISMALYDKNKEIFKVIPYDDDKKIVRPQYTQSYEADIINLEVKKCILKKFWFRIDDVSIISNMKETNSIYIIYKDEKGKLKKVLVRKGVLNKM